MRHGQQHQQQCPCICSPSIPVGPQVGYWLMIITAVAELLGDRRLTEEEEKMVVISISYLFDRGISVCCGCAEKANLPLFSSIVYFGRPGGCAAGCWLGQSVDHFIIGRGRVRGREGMERDDVTMSARLCIAQPAEPGSLCSAPTHSVLLKVPASTFTYCKLWVSFSSTNQPLHESIYDTICQFATNKHTSVLFHLHETPCYCHMLFMLFVHS